MLLYDNKFDKFPGKFRVHWLGPYIVKEVTNGSAVQLVKLNGEPFLGKVNGNRLKPYMGGPTIWLVGRSTVFMLQGSGWRRGIINKCKEHKHRCKEAVLTLQSQNNTYRRSSRQPLSALPTLQQFGQSWRDSTWRSPRWQCDSRASHDVCVGGLLGMEFPQGMFCGLKPKFWPSLL